MSLSILFLQTFSLVCTKIDNNNNNGLNIYHLLGIQTPVKVFDNAKGLGSL